MKKLLLLFAALLLPIIGFSQVDLVRWTGASQSAAPTLFNTNITAGDLTGQGITLAMNNNSEFRITDWPTNNTPNLTKYIQLSVTAKLGNQINLTSLVFSHNNSNNGPTKLIVRHSTDPSFPSNGTLIPGVITIGNNSAEAIIPLTGITVSPETTFYVRIYCYSASNSNGWLALSKTTTNQTGPTFKGTVSCAITGDQTTFGTTNWIGYVYDNATNANPTTAPFLTGNYKGYITETQIFDRNNGSAALTGTNLCGTYSDNFAIRYKKTINFPSGNYILTVGGDDGYRLSLDNGTTFIINNWNAQSYTTTSTNSIILNGNTNLILEYFENGGDSRVTFSYTSCDASGTTSPTAITGNNSIDCGAGSVTLTATGGNGSVYEWGTGATIGSNVIAGQTGTAITVSPTATTTYWVRRVSPAPCSLKTGGITKTITVNTTNAPGNPAIFGNNAWNVYAFATESMTPALATYKGFYTQNTLGLDTQDLANNGWSNSASPSSSAGWAGCPVAANQFTMIHKRTGFPCARYNVTINNWDDATKVFIDGVQVFSATAWSGENPTPTIIGNYALNANSKIEVITIENSGQANVKLTLTATDTTATYNGTWNTDPNGLAVHINSNLVLAADLNVCSCHVQGGATMTVSNGVTLKVDDFVKVNPNSTLIVEDKGSLVQVNDAAANEGKIIVKRKSAPMKQFDFTYWSAPVQNWKLNQLSPSSTVFYSFNPLVNNWVGNAGAQIMNPAKGYIVRAPQGWSTTNATAGVYEGTFNGVPNSGVIPVSIQKGTGTFNLIGNPYPSAIDIDLFLLDPANSNVINGTVYLWTHNTAISSTIPGNQAYNYTADDYAKYNLTGGLKTASFAVTGGVKPDGKIASGQGFFIEANPALANGTYTANFNNSMRVVGNNGTFFRNSSATETVTTTIEKNRVWIKMSNLQGAYNEMLLGYITGATNNFDNLYDGKTFAAGNVLSLYSISGTDNYSIQGRALPFNDSEIIPLGYASTLAGTFSIAIENLDGFFVDQNVYLLDKSNNTTHDLKTSAYSFTTATGTFNNRFELRFTTDTTLNTNNPVYDDNAVTIVSNGSQINIQSSVTMESVIIYDLLGRQLLSSKINAMDFQTSGLTATHQALIVKVKLVDFEVTKKVMAK